MKREWFKVQFMFLSLNPEFVRFSCNAYLRDNKNILQKK